MLNGFYGFPQIIPDAIEVNFYGIRIVVQRTRRIKRNNSIAGAPVPVFGLAYRTRIDHMPVDNAAVFFYRDNMVIGYMYCRNEHVSVSLLQYRVNWSFGVKRPL